MFKGPTRPIDEHDLDTTAPAPAAIEDIASTNEARDDDDAYFYGYDAEHKQAWRKSSAIPTPEWGVKPPIEGKVAGDPHPWATFATGPQKTHHAGDDRRARSERLASWSALGRNT